MSWQDEAISLRKEGLSIRETSRKLSVPYSTLWDFLQRCQKDGESSKEYFPKISIFDVESAPFLSYAWRRWKQNLSQEMVVKEGYLLTAAYKELGSPLVHSCNIVELENDYPVVEALYQMMDTSDIVVGQNLDVFDVPLLNTRLVQHGFKPYSPVKTIDTLKIAKKVFKFPSNSLKSLAIYLGCTQKIENEGFNLWKKVMAGDTEALETMLEYNIGDVTTTEEVFLKLRPWWPYGQNLNAYFNDEALRCPCCGSKHVVESDGISVTSQSAFATYVCEDCGKHMRGKSNLRSKESMSSTVLNIV